MPRTKLEPSPASQSSEMDEHDNDNEVGEEEEVVDATKMGGVMDESGLTEEDRRQVRREQRQLLMELEQRDLEDARGVNNKIWNRVRYTREAVLDGINVDAIAKRAVQEVDRNIQVPRYDARRVVAKLKEKIRIAQQSTGRSTSQFDWEILGSAAGACFNAIPSGVCFLNGPLTNGQEPVSRRGQVRRRQVQEEENVEEERPEDVKGHTAKDENKLSAIEKSMADMDRYLRKKVDSTYIEGKRKLQEDHNGEVPAQVMKKFKKQGAKIDGIKFLMNPKSFTQTVENIFHFSFLVKKGTAAVSLREKSMEDDAVGTSGLMIKYLKERNDKPLARQGIMAFTMRDWRNLCRTYEVESGDLPHRKINKEAYEASLSQAST